MSIFKHVDVAAWTQGTEWSKFKKKKKVKNTMNITVFLSSPSCLYHRYDYHKHDE